MAENDKINTMREAMIRELFSDIDTLADRIGSLQSALPAVAEEIETKLQPLREDLILIVGRLEADTKRVVSEGKAELKSEGHDQRKRLEERANALLEHHAATAGEVVSSAVAKSVHEPVRHAVNEVMAVANGLDAALMEVKTASLTLKTVAGHAVQGFANELHQVAQAVAWAWWKRAALTFGAAFFGAMLALSIAKAAGWIGAPPAPAQSSSYASPDQK